MSWENRLREVTLTSSGSHSEDRVELGFQNCCSWSPPSNCFLVRIMLSQNKCMALKVSYHCWDIVEDPGIKRTSNLLRIFPLWDPGIQWHVNSWIHKTTLKGNQLLHFGRLSVVCNEPSWGTFKGGILRLHHCRREHRKGGRVKWTELGQLSPPIKTCIFHKHLL